MASTLPEKVEKVERAMCTFSEFIPTPGAALLTSPNESMSSSMMSGHGGNESGSVAEFADDEEESQHGVDCNETGLTPAQQQQLRDRNGKNSLAHLCRRFLMVLLCNPVSLWAVGGWLGMGGPMGRELGYMGGYLKIRFLKF